MGEGITFVLAVGFAVVHFLSKYMKFLDGIPRSRLLSAAGGISVAYVFLHLLPELSEYQMARGESALFETEVYLWAMSGLAIFYGLERMAALSREKKQHQTSKGKGVFWIHIISFALYNALIGYLLVEGEYKGLKGLLFYFVAMAVHFISNDHGLRETHESTYDQKARWLLSLASLIGWFVGVSMTIHEAIVTFLFAFLAGGTILNVMKEELPEHRKSSFWAFLFGLIIYSVLLFLAL
ncbi:membrane protein [Bacillus sp. FJAT-27231]|uniref:hypothetical protein n=1 Tax=Bacillus sp. FJAT-27231 TaxID=1679168 RepID=UPI000670F2C7|nr:hypothetical protein [Bacillus sp. FJAT-27231]KMY53383.1 membrane protein [Bacillus sp. FJAT-27231]